MFDCNLNKPADSIRYSGYNRLVYIGLPSYSRSEFIKRDMGRLFLKCYDEQLLLLRIELCKGLKGVAKGKLFSHDKLRLPATRWHGYLPRTIHFPNAGLIRRAGNSDGKRIHDKSGPFFYLHPIRPSWWKLRGY